MKWKMFSQIVLLMIIGAIIFYTVCSKSILYPKPKWKPFIAR